MDVMTTIDATDTDEDHEAMRDEVRCFVAKHYYGHAWRTRVSDPEVSALVAEVFAEAELLTRSEIWHRAFVVVDQHVSDSVHDDSRDN